MAHAGHQLPQALPVELEENVAADVVEVEDGDVGWQAYAGQPLADLLEEWGRRREEGGRFTVRGEQAWLWYTHTARNRMRRGTVYGKEPYTEGAHTSIVHPPRCSGGSEGGGC